MQIIRDFSAEASKQFDDNSVDMVFIDGGHSEDEIKSDIEAWLPKVNQLICGHDYQWSGVKKVVDKTFGDRVKQIDSIWYVELT